MLYDSWEDIVARADTDTLIALRRQEDEKLLSCERVVEFYRERVRVIDKELAKRDF